VDHQFAFILTDVHVRPFLFFYRNPQRELHLDEPAEVLDGCLIIVYRSKFHVKASSVLTKFMVFFRDHLIPELKNLEVVKLNFEWIFIVP